MDLDPDQGLVRLREKGETLRWQPISLDLAAHLVDHGPRISCCVIGTGVR
jgi:hypothetical protein